MCAEIPMLRYRSMGVLRAMMIFQFKVERPAARRARSSNGDGS
jgi:hypothetical protein